MATAVDDGTARTWDATNGQELLTLSGESGGIFGVAFSPDGSHLATAGRDGNLRLYILPIKELVELAESRVTRSLTDDECRQYLNVEHCPPTP